MRFAHSVRLPAIAIAICIHGLIVLGGPDAAGGSMPGRAVARPSRRVAPRAPEDGVPPGPTTSPPSITAPAPPRKEPASTGIESATGAFHMPIVPAPTSTSAGCAGGYSESELNALIHDSVTGAGGIVGADYARAQILPDGRVLWVFQDVFVGGDGSRLDRASFVHNAGLVQDGSCFQLLRSDFNRSWIGGRDERPLHHWFWPLGSVVTDDGRLAQFMVEMRNPNGTGAADGARPVAVWIATINLDDFSVIDLSPAPDSRDRPLYGFSITSDHDYTYLYGNCYRQFADPGYVGSHDVGCGPLVYVARVPVGHPESPPEYWSGTTWTTGRDDAVPIMARGVFANPIQVREVANVYVSVAKLDDWWGNTLDIEIARFPQGPFVLVASIEVPLLCKGCNTYFAHLLPWTTPEGALLIAISNNAWNMRRDAFPHPELYRPSILSISLPEIQLPTTLVATST
jgi:hypothetical protein